MPSPFTWALGSAILACLALSPASFGFSCDPEPQEDRWSLLDPRNEGRLEEIHYGLDEGLPGLHVNALGLGPDGRLWVATSSGLTTFDGVGFAPPHQRLVAEADGDDVDGAGAKNEYIVALHRDAKRRMWTATQQGTVRRYDEDEIVNLEVSDRLIWAPFMEEANDGSMWVGGVGLIRISDDGVESIIDCDGDRNMTLTSLAVQPAGTGNYDDSTMWLTTVKGTFRWTKAEGLKQVDNRRCLGVFFDGRGRRWSVLDETIEVEGRTTPRPDARGSISLHDSIKIDADESLVYLSGQALRCVMTSQGPEATCHGAPHAYRAALRGAGNTFWVAEGTGGLRFASLRGYTSIPVPYAGQQLFGVRALGGDRVGFATSSSPTLWTARPTPLNPSGEPVESIEWDNSAEEARPIYGLYDMALDASDSGWLMTRSGLIAVSERRLKQASKNRASSRGSGQMVRLPSGDVWAVDGDALAEFRNGQPTGRSIPSVNRLLSSLVAVDEQIFAFHAEKIVRYDTAELISTIVVDLPGTLFGSLFPDGTGDLWIGTDGSGILRRRSTGEIDRWTVEQGLPSDYIGWVGRVPGPTQPTHLWASTTEGMIAITIESLEEAAAGTRDLLGFSLIEAGEPLGGVGAPLENGLLVLPTIEGPISIDTRDPLPKPLPPKVSLGEIRADGERLDPGTSPIGSTTLSFDFRAIQFPYRRSSIVEYQLENHDEGWTRAGKTRTVRYAQLPYGDYSFRVRARSAGGEFGPVVSTPMVSIQPHWHERPANRIGAAALTLGLAALLLRRRTQRILKHSQELEAEVTRRSLAEASLLAAQAKESGYRKKLARAEEAERSRIARELHDDLSQRLAAASLELRATTVDLEPKITTSESQALKNSVGAIETIATDVHVLSRQLHPAVLDDLGLVAALRSECKRRGALMSARVSFDEGDCPKDVRGEVGLALFRVAQEALQNAGKHAGAQEVHVRVERTESGLRLTVSDDGCGFDPSDPRGAGLGLSSMLERMKLVGGELQIRSVPGEGTQLVAWASLKDRSEESNGQRSASGTKAQNDLIPRPEAGTPSGLAKDLSGTCPTE